MNNALAINEGAEDALPEAMVKPLFIKQRQRQRPKDSGSLWSGKEECESTFQDKNVFSLISFDWCPP